MMDHWIIGADHWIDHWSMNMMDDWITGARICWITRSLDELLEREDDASLVHWSRKMMDGSLEHEVDGSLEHWSTKSIHFRSTTPSIFDDRIALLLS